MENTSGQGKGAIVPDEVRGWSWGAFLMNWIWGLFNRTWIALAIFVPVIGFVVWIVLGIKGREWAWRNKRWDDVEHFNRVQRLWAIAGLVSWLLPVVLVGAAVSFLGVDLDSLVDAPPPPAAKSAAAVPKAAPAAKAPPPAAAPAAKAPAPSAPAVVAVAPAPAPAPAAAAAKPAPSPAAAPRKTPRTDSGAGTAAAPTAKSTPTPAPVPEPAAGPPGMAIAAVVPEPVRPTPTMPSPRYNDVMTAVVYGDEAGVREALAFGRYVDQRDSNGLTPLIVAAMRRDLPAARLLLDGGANPRLTAGAGQSAMSVARENGDAGMVALLRRYGVPER